MDQKTSSIVLIKEAEDFSLKNTIPMEEVEDSSIVQAYHEPYPYEGSNKSSPMDQKTSSIVLSKEAEDFSLKNTVPMEEAEDSYSMNLSTFEQILNKEAKDSSPKYL